MREQKRARDEEKKKKQDKLTGGMSDSLFGADGKSAVTNAFIDKILRDEDPFSVEEQKAQDEVKEQLKMSSFVIDMTIAPPEKVLTYERNIQCQIIDASMVKYL